MPLKGLLTYRTNSIFNEQRVLPLGKNFFWLLAVTTSYRTVTERLLKPFAGLDSAYAECVSH